MAHEPRRTPPVRPTRGVHEKGMNRNTSPASPIACTTAAGSGSGASSPNTPSSPNGGAAPTFRDASPAATASARRRRRRPTAGRATGVLARPIGDVPPAVGRLEAGIDVPARITGIELGRKPDDEQPEVPGAAPRRRDREVGESLRRGAGSRRRAAPRHRLQSSEPPAPASSSGRARRCAASAAARSRTSSATARGNAERRCTNPCSTN